MKIFKYFLIIILFFGTCYYSISYSSESKKYKILNQILKETSFSKKNICYRKNLVSYDKEIFGSMEWYDQPSVYFQRIYHNLMTDLEIDYKIQKEKMTDSKVISDCNTEMKERKIDENTFELISNNNIMISLPILSLDKKTAIIQLTHNCGMLCGSSQLYLFKKIKGKWVKVKEKLIWIS